MRALLNAVTTRIIGIIVLTVIAGCVPASPLVLRSTYTPPPERQTVRRVQTKSQTVCSVRLGLITDKRTDPSTLGTVVGRPVRPPADIKKWLGQTFHELNAYGVVVTDSDTTEANIRIDVELLMVWVSELRSAKTANVVVRANYHVRDQGMDDDPKLYRGNANGINWASGDSELQSMIDISFTRILQSMGNDLRTMCSSID